MHLAVRSDEDGDAGRALLIGAFGRPVGEGHGPVGVAQQVGGQTDFIAPGLQIVRRAECYAQQDGVLIGIFLDSSTEPIGLLGSIVAEGARIEPDQDVLARVVREADVLPILVGQGKGRRDAADVG